MTVKYMSTTAHISHPKPYPSTDCIGSYNTLTVGSPAECTSTSPQHIWVARICCRWSNDVQHSVRWSTRSHSEHNIRTIDEVTSFLCLSARL